MRDVGDPFILFASTEVGSGGSNTPQAAALMNPHGEPMEIEEVRWRILPEIPEADSDSDYTDVTGQGIGVKMDLGNLPVVNGDVPISSFGTMRDSYENQNIQANSNAAQVYPFTYGWRLRHPLYVPAGATLVPVYSHLGQNAFPIRVETAYLCRRTPGNKPNRVMVPWVTKYNSKVFSYAETVGADSDKSAVIDLVNPFDTPLHLSRITGRLVFMSNVTSAGPVDRPNLSYEDSSPFRQTILSVRMRSSRGADIVREATSFDGLFPFNWRVWEVPAGWQMRPKEFYTVDLNTAAITADFADSDPAGRVQASIAIVGYRELGREAAP